MTVPLSGKAVICVASSLHDSGLCFGAIFSTPSTQIYPASPRAFPFPLPFFRFLHGSYLLPTDCGLCFIICLLDSLSTPLSRLGLLPTLTSPLCLEHCLAHIWINPQHE